MASFDGFDLGSFDASSFDLETSTVDVRVSWVELDAGQAVNVRVSWFEFDSAQAFVDVRLSWLEWDSDIRNDFVPATRGFMVNMGTLIGRM